MKLTKLALAVMISLGCLVTPVKKAEAGFVFGIAGVGLTAAILMTGGAGIGLSTMFLEDHSRNDKLSNVLFGLGIAVMLLDTKADALSADLSKEFPSIPDYIISEVAHTVTEKANAIPFNLDGVKSITLTSAEVAQIEEAMPLDIPAEELNAFRELLLTEIAI